MMVAGVVKNMTGESAQRAALGAGSIVMDVLASNDKRLLYLGKFVMMKFIFVILWFSVTTMIHDLCMIRNVHLYRTVLKINCVTMSHVNLHVQGSTSQNLFEYFDWLITQVSEK